MEGQISRRELLQQGSTRALLSAVGIGGLASLLANRQAVAAGTVIAVVGVTSEEGRDGPGATHRHTFSAGFLFKELNPNTGSIRGDLIGQTLATLETGTEDATPHIHPIRLFNVLIGQSGQTQVAGQHIHSLQID